MDIGSLFSSWNKSGSTPTASKATTTIKGIVCSISVKANNTSLRIRCEATEDPILKRALEERNDGTIYVSIAGKSSNVQTLDSVVLEGCQESNSRQDGRTFLNTQSVLVTKPWREVCTGNALSIEHVVKPQEGSRYGPAFILSTESYAMFPGVHRVVNWWNDDQTMIWNNSKTNKNERRLTVQITQRQWETEEEARDNPEPLHLKMLIWEDQQCPLLPKDLKKWKPIMQKHHIPFYAMCCVDSDYSTLSEVSLATIGVQWDIRRYLEETCPKMSLEQVQESIPKSVQQDEGDVVNVSETKKVPTGPGWKYYKLEDIIFAVWSVKRESSSSSGGGGGQKKRKTTKN